MMDGNNISAVSFSNTIRVSKIEPTNNISEEFGFLGEIVRDIVHSLDLLCCLIK